MDLYAFMLQPNLERQRHVRFHAYEHAPEVFLNPLQRSLGFSFKSQHDPRCGVGRTRQPKSVRVFHADAVDSDDFGRAFELARVANLVDSACGSPSLSCQLSSGVEIASGSAFSGAFESAFLLTISSNRAPQ